VVADTFRRALETAVDDLVSAPLRWPEMDPGVRRHHLGGFPYSLLYSIDERHVTILAVMHDRRRPGYWR
jgi:plasmid stabilization system protein ParE